MTRFEQAKKALLEEAFVHTNGTRDSLAMYIGVSRRTISYWIARYFPKLKNVASNLNTSKRRDEWYNKDKW